MAEISTIARPYAQAVFDIADSSAALARWSQTLYRLAEIASQPQLRELIGNPSVTQAQLVDLVVSLGGDALASEEVEFVRALVANGRLAALPQVALLYEALRHEREGVVEARIYSAFALDDAELASLVRQLEARFKRKVEPQVTVDADLIGGARIVVGDEVIDGSVRGKLEAMAGALVA